MAETATIIAALKFTDGVVIASDSQASDVVAQVRWPIEKLDRIDDKPLVVGFSGSVGMGQRARRGLEETNLYPNAFNKRHIVQATMDRCLAPIYKKIKEETHTPANIPQVCLWGLSVFWAENAPQIFENEITGDSSFHDYFHAIGSAANTAYAIYRTLGDIKLCNVTERWALPVILRILRTCIKVEVWGVSEPLSVWVVSAGRARKISLDEIQAHLQTVDGWEERERSDFFSKM
jgi:20S proteasome alpha/beta subunit